MKKKELKILVLSIDNKAKQFKLIEDAWKKYFNCKVIFETPDKVKKYINKNIDILFTDSEELFEISFYEEFHKVNKSFSYNVVKKEISEDDIQTYKNLADSVLYYGYGMNHFKWQTISVLRRYWDDASKEGVIIYNGIIADFLESKYSVNAKPIDLTQKEAQLLKFFLSNPSKYMLKAEIFESVWGYEGSDSTRAVDQMIFKLKKKIGTEYFYTKRNKGICFK